MFLQTASAPERKWLGLSLGWQLHSFWSKGRDNNDSLSVEHSLHARHQVVYCVVPFSSPYLETEVLLLVIVILQKRIMLFRVVDLPRAAWSGL